MPNDVKTTPLQKRTLEIKRDHPDMPMGEAMRKAGYSAKTSVQPGHNFVERKGTQIAIEAWREKLRGIGITDDLLANKHKEWLGATKIKSSLTEPDKVVPDYQTQLKAGEMIRKDFGIDSDQPDVQTNIQINIVRDYETNNS